MTNCIKKTILLPVKLLINSIYAGVEGEGVRIGTGQIFVRFQGCRLGCHNCDSKDTWAFKSSWERPLAAVVEDIETLSEGESGWVSITGGDPLDIRHREGVIALLKILRQKGFRINLEAAGNSIVPDIFDLCDHLAFDYKTPSTGVVTDHRLILRLCREYGGKFQVKSVARDEKDIRSAYLARREVRQTLGSPLPFTWCLTPAWEREEDFPQQRFENILEKNRRLGNPFRVIGQQHKWIYGPQRRDV